MEGQSRRRDLTRVPNSFQLGGLVPVGQLVLLKGRQDDHPLCSWLRKHLPDLLLLMRFSFFNHEHTENGSTICKQSKTQKFPLHCQRPRIPLLSPE